MYLVSGKQILSPNSDDHSVWCLLPAEVLRQVHSILARESQNESEAVCGSEWHLRVETTSFHSL